MPIKPDTCWGVCNMPLPIPDKYLINTYLLNPIPEKDRIVWIIMPIKLGTCWGVCNTPLSIRNKYLINTHLLNPILDKDWIVCIGAYCIRPTNAHDHEQMIDPPGTCWGVCNTPLPIRDKYLINKCLLNLISGKDWMVCVGAYCIRHTNTHDHGQMIDPPGTFRGVCNTPLPIRNKNLIPLRTMNLKPGMCWGICNTPLPILDKYLMNTYLLNPILGKD